MDPNSTQDSPQGTYTKEALKVIYYVIIGIAITEALNRAFLKEGTFLGLQIFETNNLPSIILLFVFLPTICRFVHGASIHLDMPSLKRYKPLVDFFGFFLQSSFFYLMALSLENPVAFTYIFSFLLLSDALWLIFLQMIGYIKFSKEKGHPEIQWLMSDFVIIVLLFVLIILDPAMRHIWSLVAILIIGFVATIFDYLLNQDFYFPEV